MSRKAVLKRIKITKSGKMLFRRQGRNHFNAKQSRMVQNRSKKLVEMTGTTAKNFKAYISH